MSLTRRVPICLERATGPALARAMSGADEPVHVGSRREADDYAYCTLTCDSQQPDTDAVYRAADRLDLSADERVRREDVHHGGRGAPRVGVRCVPIDPVFRREVAPWSEASGRVHVSDGPERPRSSAGPVRATGTGPWRTADGSAAAPHARLGPSAEAYVRQGGAAEGLARGREVVPWNESGRRARASNGSRGRGQGVPPPGPTRASRVDSQRVAGSVADALSVSPRPPAGGHQGDADGGSRARAQITVFGFAHERGPSPSPAAPSSAQRVPSDGGDGAAAGEWPWETGPLESVRTSPVAWNDALVLARQFIDYMHNTVDTDNGNMCETENIILETEAAMQKNERELLQWIQTASDPERGPVDTVIASLVVDVRHVKSSVDEAIRRAIAAAVGGDPDPMPHAGRRVLLPLLQILCAAFTCHRLESEPVPDPYKVVFGRLTMYFLGDCARRALGQSSEAAAMTVTHFVNVGMFAGGGQVDLPVRRAVAMLAKHIATLPNRQDPSLMDTFYVRELAAATSCCAASGALVGARDTLQAFLRRWPAHEGSAGGVFATLYRLNQCITYAVGCTGRDVSRDMARQRLTATEMSTYKGVLEPTDT